MDRKEWRKIKGIVEGEFRSSIGSPYRAVTPSATLYPLVLRAFQCPAASHESEPYGCVRKTRIGPLNHDPCIGTISRPAASNATRISRYAYERGQLSSTHNTPHPCSPRCFPFVNAWRITSRWVNWSPSHLYNDL